MGIMKLTNGEMPVSTPEEQGISSEDILLFMEEIQKRDCHLHSFHIIRHGKLIASAVASPFTPESFHRIFSAAKGVVATGVLVAIQEGFFRMDDRVVDLLSGDSFPENMDEKWERLTVYHLLTLTTGHKEDTLCEMFDEQEFLRTFFKVKPQYEPGTRFCYDMGAQYVMNEIIRQKTGRDLGEFLRPRIFDPMGIEYRNNYTPDGRFFSSTIQFRPDALPKLAQLYLQEGIWEDSRLIRRDLAQLAARCHVPNSEYRGDGEYDHDDHAMLCDYRFICTFCENQIEISVVTGAHDHHEKGEPVDMASRAVRVMLYGEVKD